MGLRRTTSVPLHFHSVVAPGTVSPSQGKGGDETTTAAAVSKSTSASALLDVVLSSSVETGPPTRSLRAKASSSRIAAEKATAAAKPARERGLTTRTRPTSKSGVLAAASSSSSSLAAAAAAAEAEGPQVSVVGDPQDPQDGMAPALTEPTVVPTAATTTTKTDSSSPKPEIFAVGERGAFNEDQSMAGNTESVAVDKMGVGGGDQELHVHLQQQKKAPKRTKKDEYPLKELRSTRRRSNLPPQTSSSTPVGRQSNGKTGRPPRWSSSGGNGGTLVREREKAPVANGDRDSVNTEEKEVVVMVKEEVVEPSGVVAEGEVAMNNNYLDKNRVPIRDSAVKEDPDRAMDEGPAPTPAATTNGPESNSAPLPVIKSEISELEEKANTLEDGGYETQEVPPLQNVQDQVDWAQKLNGDQPQPLEALNESSAGDCVSGQSLMLPPEMSTGAGDPFKVTVSDQALLEELVLTTPTKKLTEQLCMVLKDQERALEQQEQQMQQQQQQQPASNPSSQTLAKESAEMEQMLGDLAATSELDLLQVFKSFDSGPVADDGGTVAHGNLLSLLGGDDDVDMMMGASPEKGAVTISRKRNVQDRQSPEVDIAERQKMLTEMEQELSQMQRRRDFLLRRLRKQQVHHMGRQLSEEVVGLFELSARAASSGPPKVVSVADGHHSYNKLKYLKNNVRPGANVTVSTPVVVEDASAVADVEELTPASIVMRTDPPSPVIDLKGRSKTAVGHHPFIKPPSPKSIRSFVEKVVASSSAPPAASLKPSQMTTTTTVVNNNISQKMRPPGFPLDSKSTLDDGHRLQLTNNVGLLKTELRIVERAVDSEATASSSGGESADELINYSNTVQETLAIANRAAWRWAQERARLASRWNWLTAEISDLEYRIRQHTDLHNQLRKNKGPVLLLPPSPVANEASGGGGGEAVDTNPSPGNVNGYRGVLPGQYSSGKSFEGVAGADGFLADVENELEGTASRTRPYQRTVFKKRKLVQTMNLHTISKKAARPSSIKCGCQWPQQPCALCTGRSDPTVPRPLPDMIPRMQRAALLDPGLHPCLSFPQDVSQSIRCEAVLGDAQWQHKVLKSSKTALKSSIVAAAAAAGGTYKGLKLKKDDLGKKSGKKYTQGLINRYKKSKNKSRGTHTKYVQLLKQQKSRKAAIKAGLSVSLPHGSGVVADLELGEYESGVARSRNASPTHHYHRHEKIERRSRHSYDIDNIVIPYSIAAATRVEILPYKEIPTPKWKLVDDTDLDEDIQVETNHYQQQQQQAASSDSNSSTITALEFDSEEYLEECIQEKHTRALLEERKKFSTFLKFPYSTRSRANRRIDSRAESSGANTPDPASPAPNTPSIGGDQESIPSPACPSTPAPESVMESETSSQGVLNNSLSVVGTSNRISQNERRRTISLKMLSHQNSTASDMGQSRQRSLTPEPPGPPFERLDYPLSERRYEEMLRQMPLNHERLDDISKVYAEGNTTATSRAPSEGKLKLDNGGEGGGAVKRMSGGDVGVESGASPAVMMDASDSESIESVLAEDPDPNDPEWVNS